MSRNSKTDVRAKVNAINENLDDSELTFNCWGVGVNKYQLMDSKSGRTFGRVCNGATEFLTFLNGFEEGMRNT